MKAYKAFDKDFKCRGFQYEVGKSYTHDQEIKICNSGFHSCLSPLDILNYYDLTNSLFAIVEAKGEIQTHDEDSKIVSSEIEIIKELSLAEFIKEAIDFSSKLAASGNYSKLAASGDAGTLAASGTGSKLAASGNGSNLAASGTGSNLAASGNGSKLAASGENSSVASIGLNSEAMAGKNGMLILTYFDGIRVRSITGYVDENGIKSNTWYRVNEKGELEECQGND